MLLAEELLLLAIDDEIGKISTSVSGSIHYGIAGAFLLDLGIREKIKIENKKLKIIDEDPTGNLILDEIMELLKQGKFRRKIRYVIVSLGNLYTKLYRKELFKRLTERGILNRVEKKKFKIFRTVRHPVAEPQAKEELLMKIQDTPLGEIEPKERMLSLLSIIHAIGLDHSLFGREFRKKFRYKLDEIIKSNKIADQVQKQIQAMLAVFTSVILPSVF